MKDKTARSHVSLARQAILLAVVLAGCTPSARPSFFYAPRPDDLSGPRVMWNAKYIYHCEKDGFDCWEEARKQCPHGYMVIVARRIPPNPYPEDEVRRSGGWGADYVFPYASPHLVIQCSEQIGVPDWSGAQMPPGRPIWSDSS